MLRDLCLNIQTFRFLLFLQSVSVGEQRAHRRSEISWQVLYSYNEDGTINMN